MMTRVDDPGLIDATEAAHRLGVKVSSLYAYVSRGLVRRQRQAGDRGSWFDPKEIYEFTQRKAVHRTHGLDLAVETAITLIDGERLWYRGYDATWLGRNVAFESVCHLLWMGELHFSGFTAAPATIDAAFRAAEALGGQGRLVDRVAVAVSAAASADLLRFDLAPASVADTGGTLLATMVGALPDGAGGAGGAERAAGAGRIPVLVLADGTRRRNSLAGRLWARLAPATSGKGASAVAVLNEVLILLADHELATSTLGARVAASTRASPYAAVSAALGALDGPLHGTVSEDVVSLLENAAGPSGAMGAVGDRLRRGQMIPGFGSRLYHPGDPRAVAMLAALDGLATKNGPRIAARMAVVHAALGAAAAKSAAAPNSDFGLGAFVFVTGMAADAGEAIFAIARTAGWVAHALEEYQQEPLRFRGGALYIGPAPGRTVGRPDSVVGAASPNK